MRCIMQKMVVSLAALALAAPAAAAEVNVWSTSFDSEDPFEVMGPFPFSALLVDTTDGFVYSSPGSVPGFGTRYLHKVTDTSTNFATYGLGAHTALRLKFDLLFQDSWDSLDGAFGTAPDILYVTINGTSYEWTVNNASGSIFDVGPGVVISTGSNLVGSYWADTVVSYNFLIPHTDSDFIVTFRFGGAGFQGGTDESWGIDNWSLAAIPASGAVPEPASWALLIAGFGLVGASARRRRPASA